MRLLLVRYGKPQSGIHPIGPLPDVQSTVNQPELPQGDANGDGSTTVQDVFYLINNLFSGGPPPAKAGKDPNGDGSTTVADSFYLINYLFSAGPAPR